MQNAKYKKLTRDQKIRILALDEEKLSFRQIAARIDCSHTTIVRLLQKKENSDMLERKKGSGRPRKSTEQTDNLLRRISLNDRLKSALSITAAANLVY